MKLKSNQPLNTCLKAGADGITQRVFGFFSVSSVDVNRIIAKIFVI